MTLLRKLNRLRRRHARNDDGNATIEFALIFPMFMFLIMGSYEIGYYTVSSAMLERGLDNAVRDVRLGNMPSVTLDSLKSATCEYARYVRNCEENIHIALEPVDAWNFTRPTYIAECIDRSADVAPSTVFEDGAANELMLVRACVNVDPIFPTTWIGAAMQRTEGSGYAIVATGGFVNEPNS